jgi:hypothetical protein
MRLPKPNVEVFHPISTLRRPENPSPENADVEAPPDLYSQPIVLSAHHLQQWNFFALSMAPFLTLSSRNDNVYEDGMVAELSTYDCNDEPRPAFLFSRPELPEPQSDQSSAVLLALRFSKMSEIARHRRFENLFPRRSMWNLTALKRRIGSAERQSQAKLNTIVYGNDFDVGEVEDVHFVTGKAKDAEPKRVMDFAWGEKTPKEDGKASESANETAKVEKPEKKDTKNEDNGPS